MNRCVELSAAPRKIVSVVPSQTEMLFDWGLEREIAAVTKFCVHPAGMVAAKPRIGGTKKLHLERIAALSPDLIVGNKEENTREDIEWLAARFPVWMSDVATLGQALDMMVRLGEVVGRPLEAAVLAEEIRRRFGELAVDIQAFPPRRAAYLIWRGPLMVAAGDTFIHDMLRAAGLENVFGGQKRYPAVEPADLVAARPDLVLLSSEPYPFSAAHLSEIKAFCPWAEIRLVDGELFSWYGSRLLLAPDYFRKLAAGVC